jgi:dihydroorotase
VHGEVTTHEVDIFDREAVFIDTVLDPLRRRIPGLRVVMEHITTEEGVDARSGGPIWGPRSPPITWSSTATISSWAGSSRITTACRSPSAKSTACLARRRHLGRCAVLPRHRQRAACRCAEGTACGCAGCFTATNTMAILAHVFEEEGALDRLEAFASLNGPAFYRLPPNEARITLTPVHPCAGGRRRS